ncbi:MAG: ComF family protein [Candidatus Moraniibacteriota bacterium]|nr:MAG: ComF family protein [Candidatus Moranbacteria bacterium]
MEYQICSECGKGSIDGLTHPKCRTRYGMDGLISAISYKGIVKKLLYQFKYPPYLSDLKTILGALMYEGLIQQAVFVKFTENKNLVLVPVPLHANRLRRRGYNQAELLSNVLSQKMEIPVKNLLVRIRDSKPQYKLTREERGRNIFEAFSFNAKIKSFPKDKNVILVDDITTSGITMRECTKILKRNGIQKVLGITLAHEG